MIASSTTSYTVTEIIKPAEGVLYAPLRIPTAEAFSVKPIEWTPEYVQERIIFWSNVWDYSSSTALAVAKCESGFNVSAIGDHGAAVGVFQFHPQTFKDFNCLFEDQEDGCVPRELLDRGNPEHNIKLGVWGLSHGKESHWTCHTKLFRRTTPH